VLVLLDSKKLLHRVAKELHKAAFSVPRSRLLYTVP